MAGLRPALLARAAADDLAPCTQRSGDRKLRARRAGGRGAARSARSLDWLPGGRRALALSAQCRGTHLLARSGNPGPAVPAAVSARRAHRLRLRCGHARQYPHHLHQPGGAAAHLADALSRRAPQLPFGALPRARHGERAAAVRRARHLARVRGVASGAAAAAARRGTLVSTPSLVVDGVRQHRLALGDELEHRLILCRVDARILVVREHLLPYPAGALLRGELALERPLLEGGVVGDGRLVEGALEVRQGVRAAQEVASGSDLADRIE